MEIFWWCFGAMVVARFVELLVVLSYNFTQGVKKGYGECGKKKYFF